MKSYGVAIQMKKIFLCSGRRLDSYESFKMQKLVIEVWISSWAYSISWLAQILAANIRCLLGLEATILQITLWNIDTM